MNRDRCHASGDFHDYYGGSPVLPLELCPYEPHDDHICAECGVIRSLPHPWFELGAGPMGMVVPQ